MAISICKTLIHTHAHMHAPTHTTKGMSINYGWMVPWCSVVGHTNSLSPSLLRLHAYTHLFSFARFLFASKWCLRVLKHSKFLTTFSIKFTYLSHWLELRYSCAIDSSPCEKIISWELFLAIAPLSLSRSVFFYFLPCLNINKAYRVYYSKPIYQLFVCLASFCACLCVCVASPLFSVQHFSRSKLLNWYWCHLEVLSMQYVLHWLQHNTTQHIRLAAETLIDWDEFQFISSPQSNRIHFVWILCVVFSLFLSKGRKKMEFYRLDVERNVAGFIIWSRYFTGTENRFLITTCYTSNNNHHDNDHNFPFYWANCGMCCVLFGETFNETDEIFEYRSDVQTALHHAPFNQYSTRVEIGHSVKPILFLRSNNAIIIKVKCVCVCFFASLFAC